MSVASKTNLTTEEDKTPPILYKHGNEYTQAAGSSESVERPEPGVYTLKVTEGAIKLIRDDKYKYTFPKKMYGDVPGTGNAILRTWLSRDKNTGVLLSGHQGTGKSLMAQFLINKGITQHNAVVIEVTEPLLSPEAFKFIQGLQCPVMIFVDEFEKKYDYEAQAKNLGNMDGSSLEGVLWILTVNNRHRVQDHYFHRPSRIYFHIKYDNVDMQTVEGIVDEKLDMKVFLQNRKRNQLPNTNITEIDLKRDIIRAISTFSIRTFDTILAFINELNTSGNTPEKVLDYLNIEKHQRNKESNRVYYRLYVVGEDKDKPEDITDEYMERPLQRFLRFHNVFGDGNGIEVNEFTEIQLISQNKIYPTVTDFKMDAESFVETEDYNILKFKVGDTPSGKTVYLEFSKKPYPPRPPKPEPEENKYFPNKKPKTMVRAPGAKIKPK